MILQNTTGTFPLRAPLSGALTNGAAFPKKLNQKALDGLFTLVAQEEFALRPEQPLGQAAALDQEEPVPAAGRHALVDIFEPIKGRDDVEQGGAFDALGMIPQQPVRDAGAAVVPRHAKALEAERLHRLDLVLRQCALGVGGKIGPGRRLRTVAVAAQVGDHQREVLRQSRRHLAPHHMRLRIAVQQEQRRPAATRHQVDFGTGGGDAALCKPGKEIGHFYSVRK